MAIPIPETRFTDAAPVRCLEQAAAALTAHWFTVEILDDAAAARARVRELIPAGASVLTAASETLRESGIDEDINSSSRYQAPAHPQRRPPPRTQHHPAAPRAHRILKSARKVQ